LRRHANFAYGTHFTIGPYRVTVGRPGQSERPMLAADEVTPPRGTPVPIPSRTPVSAIRAQQPPTGQYPSHAQLAMTGQHAAHVTHLVHGKPAPMTGQHPAHVAANAGQHHAAPTGQHPAMLPPSPPNGVPAVPPMPFQPPPGFLVVQQQKQQTNK